MEKVKKHLPLIAGALAVTVGVGAYLYMKSGKKASVKDVPSIETMLSQLEDDSWPKVRRIMDSDGSAAQQKIQLDNWIERVFKAFIKKHGPFRTNEAGVLEESEFMMIYDLIEAVSRYQLRETREKHETARSDLFKVSFAAGGSGA